LLVVSVILISIWSHDHVLLRRTAQRSAGQVSTNNSSSRTKPFHIA